MKYDNVNTFLDKYWYFAIISNNLVMISNNERAHHVSNQLYRDRVTVLTLLAEWVRYYNEERLHSSLEYLRPVDYYLGNPQALLAKRKTKLREAAARRKEVNRGKKGIRLVNGAPELWRSERGAEATAEARG